MSNTTITLCPGLNQPCCIWFLLRTQGPRGIRSRQIKGWNLVSNGQQTRHLANKHPKENWEQGLDRFSIFACAWERDWDRTTKRSWRSNLYQTNSMVWDHVFSLNSCKDLGLYGPPLATQCIYIKIFFRWMNIKVIYKSWTCFFLYIFFKLVNQNSLFFINFIN